MAQTTNPRKAVAIDVKLAVISGLDTETYTVEADAVNPYAFVVKCDGKIFRVIVKEV